MVTPTFSEPLRTSARVSGQIAGGEAGFDLALYALFSNVEVVVIRAGLVSPTSSLETDLKVACNVLGFDPTMEAVKTRVVCVVLYRDHFQIGPRVCARFFSGD